jgi:hypothetical protein
VDACQHVSISAARTIVGCDVDIQQPAGVDGGDPADGNGRINRRRSCR